MIKVEKQFKKKAAKVVPKEVTVSYILDLVKKEEHEKALAEVLRVLPKIDRVLFAAEYVAKAKFRAFKIANQNFIALISRFVEFGDKQDLEIYLNNLTEDHTDHIYDNFVSVRRCIVTDLIKDDYTHSLHALVETVETFITDDDFEAEKNKKLKALVADCASLKWEEAKGLKALFGS